MHYFNTNSNFAEKEYEHNSSFCDMVTNRESSSIISELSICVSYIFRFTFSVIN